MKNNSIAVLLGSLMVVMLCMMPSHASAASIVIDNFEIGQGDDTTPAVQANFGGSDQNATYDNPANGNIVGGWRYIRVQQTNSVSTNIRGYVNGDPTPSQKAFSISNGVGSEGRGSAYWTGEHSTTGCALNLDLDAATKISLLDIYLDHNATITVNIFSDGGSNSSVASRHFSTAGGPVTGDWEFLKAAFSGTADFSAICRIELHVVPDTTDLQFTVKDFVAETAEPKIRCSSKMCTLNPDYTTGLSSAINLAGSASFPFPLYCVFTVTNTGDGNDTVQIQDTLPGAMVLNNVNPVAVTQPLPLNSFDLGPASGVGPGTVSWESNDELKSTSGINTLVFRYRIDVSSFDAANPQINSFRAKGKSESWDDQDQKTCPFTLTRGSQVPSLNEWGMIILSLVLAASAVWLVRRRRTS